MSRIVRLKENDHDGRDQKAGKAGEARIAPEVHALLKRAAEIEGRSITDFVVTAASAAARRTLEQAETIRLSADSSAFVASLLADARPVPAMRKAKEQHDALVAKG